MGTNGGAVNGGVGAEGYGAVMKVELGVISKELGLAVLGRYDRATGE
jgi:hypothetical protein